MWIKVKDRSELCNRSVVDLRVVDILVFDVRLDMDELTTIGLLVIGTLAGLSYPTRPWIWALEVKAFREARNRCSSLGCRVRVDLIGRDYGLEISKILLMVDLGIGCHSMALLRSCAR